MGSFALVAYSTGSRLIAANATTRRMALGIALLGSRFAATRTLSAHLLATIRSRLTDRRDAEAFRHTIRSRWPLEKKSRLKGASVFCKYRFYDEAQSLLSGFGADPAIDALRAICAIHTGKLAEARALLSAHSGHGAAMAGLSRARVELARMEENWDWLSLHYRNRLGTTGPAGQVSGPDALRLAEVEMARGDLGEARALLSKVLKHDETALDARLLLIRINLRSMQTEEIRAAISQLQAKQALANPAALALLGDCHAFFDQQDAAADAYEASLRRSFPFDFAAGVYRRLLASEAAGEDRSARRSQALRDCFLAYPLKTARAWVMAGRAHLEANDLGGHLACCREALKRDPGSANALQWYAHGLAWTAGLPKQGQGHAWEEVRLLYEKAIVASASHPWWIVTDYLRLCARMGDFETASTLLADYREVFEMQAMRTRSHSSRSLVYLGTGNFLEAHRAWADDANVAAARRHVPNFITSIDELSPDAKVLFLSEGGVGDEIRFSQLYDELIHRFPKAVFTVEDRLMPLMLRSFPAECLHPVRRYFRREINCNETGFIGELPHSDLAHYFDNSVWRILADFDAVVPVKPIMAQLRPDRSAFIDARIRPLEVDAAKRQEFTERLRGLGPGPYIGISWASSVSLYRRSSHYFTVDEVIDTIRRSQGTYVNLNYYDDAADLRRIEEAVGADRIVSFTDFDKRDDFDATAALMASLHLVVGVNNAVLELAGAVDAPACFCAFSPDNAWRKLERNGRDVYHKSVRVFTPLNAGDRHSVLDQVEEAVRQCAGSQIG
ncbi:MAG: hypothetical protein RIC18_18060 [Hoeflea sp.]|uniref:hypothetical protein n=1 Tax=Hoeflea sp. TaxID=1940281 RepID=UPI0032EA92AF